MKNRMRIVPLVILFMGISLLLMHINSVCLSYVNNILIIGNWDLPVDALSRDEIKSIFLGEKIMWDNGKKITFVILKTKMHEVFLKEFIGNTESQYRNYWRKLVFTGKSRSPRSFESEEDMIEYIANSSGAIGYIPSEAYTDKVKIISVRQERDK